MTTPPHFGFAISYFANDTDVNNFFSNYENSGDLSMRKGHSDSYITTGDTGVTGLDYIYSIMYMGHSIGLSHQNIDFVVAGTTLNSDSGLSDGISAGYLLAPMIYVLYNSLTDAQNNDQNNIIDSTMLGNGVYQIPNALTDFSGNTITSFGIYAPNSSGSTIGTVYPGDTLAADGSYALYPLTVASPTTCFLEGSRILCLSDGEERYTPIESLSVGTLVKTSCHGFKPIAILGHGACPTNMFKLTPDRYLQTGLLRDLVLTGCHSVLVDELTEVQRAKTISQLGRVFITDKKYRLMASIDERAIPVVTEHKQIWHVALESSDPLINYGIYAEGLLVESCSVRNLTERSNMVLESKSV